ncbi:hypothetical protein EAI_04918 [Harpegnathos saltator]|uniref:Uncharacterized protein n=1 Tax=Harpegnathos saltator TaxID=610380 RepID=E2BS93_HARSA|nr:hypothetical protein EAI_04918 [Harpegnathos saltator]
MQDCLLLSIASIKSHLVRDVQDLDLPPFDPYEIAELPFNFAFERIKSMMLFNVIIYGLMDYKINNVMANYEVSMITFDAYFGQLSVYADFMIDYISEQNRHFKISRKFINIIVINHSFHISQIS